MYSQETIDGDVSNAFKKSVKVSDGTVPICASTGQPCTNGCGGDGEKTDENASSRNVENGANGGTNAAIKEPLFPIELKRRAKAGTGPLAALEFPRRRRDYRFRAQRRREMAPTDEFERVTGFARRASWKRV